VRDEYRFSAPAAGKTGTTNDYKDAWFEGYTSHLAAGVWIGYDTPREVISGGYAAKVALPVWANVMKQETGRYAMKDFPAPDGLQEVSVGGGLFGRGERYYLTADQRGLLEQEQAAMPQEEQQPDGRNIIDRVLDIFR
jgi:membrane carboxypeptidase/penicillin-binding protein